MEWMLTVVFHFQKSQQDEKWGQSPHAEASFLSSHFLSSTPFPIFRALLLGQIRGATVYWKQGGTKPGTAVWFECDICIWKCCHQLLVPFWKAVESSESGTLIKVRGHWPGGQKPDPTSYLLCFWVTDVEWPAASHSCCQVLPGMINWFLLKPWVTISPYFSKSFLPSILLQRWNSQMGTCPVKLKLMADNGSNRFLCS